MIGSMVSRRWYDISRRVGAFESRFFTMVNVVVVVVVVVLVGVCFLPTQRPHILVKSLCGPTPSVRAPLAAPL